MKSRLIMTVFALVVCGGFARAGEIKSSTVTAVGKGSAPVMTTTVAEDACYPSSTKGPGYYQSENELRARKLARGLANVTLCVAEVPNQMFFEAYRTSPVSGAVVGAWKGLVKGSKRLAIGTWEIVTFYHPTRNHYQPYIYPEVVFQEYLH